MKRLTIISLLLSALVVTACPEPTVEVETVPKVPVTTSSKKALKYFLVGQQLADKLRFADARDEFLRAIDEDPQFALAYLYLATNSVSAKEFFSSFKKAVYLADEVSEGERHWILGQDAGNRGKPEEQLAHYEALLDLYPEDERVHNLLGIYYFGRQEYDPAIEHFARAIEIEPTFSQAYNMLGYAKRALGDYEGAEWAFKKYIELIPDEPNPYDSYAELLMKIGRFEESIENYRKALEKNPQFVFSFAGIGNNQMFAGDFEAARATFAELLGRARNNGERRTAHFWTAVSHVFEGDQAGAVAAAKEMAAIAEAEDDFAALSGDANLIGNILLYMGSPGEALSEFRRGVELAEQADVNEDVKENARRNLAYHEARVAIYSGDLAAASEKSDLFRAAAAAVGLPGEMRRSHELDGMLALEAGDPAAALVELEQANAQNPIVLFWMARAAFELADVDKARDLADQAAHFNQLTPNFAFIKSQADRLVEQIAAAE